MMNSYGELRIRAFIAHNAVPIEGAEITITGADENNGDIIFLLITDNDGVTDTVRLPTPDIKESLTPNATNQPYASYDVEIKKDGYYIKKIYGIPIFAGIGAELPVNMIPEDKNGAYPQGNLEAKIYENQYL